MGDTGASPRQRRVDLRPPPSPLISSLLEHAQDYLVVLDGGWRLRYASPGLRASVDADLVPLEGTDISTLIHPDDIPAVEAAVAAAGPGATLRDQHVRFRGRNGQWRHLIGTRSDLQADPEVGGVVWSFRDATRERQQQQRYRALAIGSTDVPFILDASSGVVVYVGPSIEPTFGYRPDDVIGRVAAELVHADDRPVAGAALEAATGPTGHPAPVCFRLRATDGRWRWVETILTDHRADPAVRGVVGHLRDVTERQEARDELLASELRYRRLVETTIEGVWAIDAEDRTTFVNATLAALLGTTVDDMVGRSCFDFVAREDWALLADRLGARRRGEATRSRYELTVRRADGSPVQLLVSSAAVFDDDGVYAGSFAMLSDVTDQKRAEAELSHLALHDALTGLPNRVLLLDRVEQTLARHGRARGAAAVLFIDLDDFKEVNDLLGHAAGDEMLRTIGRRLSLAVRGDDTVSRFGGDEFVVLAPDVVDTDEAVDLGERLLRAVAEPVPIDGRDLVMTASIGIALSPARDADRLVSHADTAMYRAKQAGGGRTALFDEVLQARTRARLELVADLRRAIVTDQLRVHYQPVVALDGTLRGLEALARWQHPTRGLLPAEAFIGLAEESGAIADLGVWMLGRACADLRRWRARDGHGSLALAVNLSGRQLSHPGLVGGIERALRAEGVDPSAVTVEITESVLMDDSPAAAATVDAIRALGCRLAVDDFGTGYSSLLYLKRFPISVLKLDRAFVAGLGRRTEDTIIVRALVDLAHALGLEAIAEGVETGEQLAVLAAMDCDLAQGFLWSPPRPPAEIDGLLAAAGGRPVQLPSVV